jgi:hypothetical protein
LRSFGFEVAARRALVDLHRRGHTAERHGDWTAGFICGVARTEDDLFETGAHPRGAKAFVFPARALAWWSGGGHGAKERNRNSP